MSLSPKGHLAMSGDIFGCRALLGQGCYWHLVLQARDAANHAESVLPKEGLSSTGESLQLSLESARCTCGNGVCRLHL